ncbi:hypothetical protein Nacho_0068 [Mycobacterium phage Nacho]|uniref:Uncharacterized protein n=1 Tax=Mycobacterium phage Nacho TaxID=1235692 RepID=L7TMH9_9CAUD|nr:hypothetical protein Nacho_0068 [Mycobacterium phage Nacho]
MPPRPIPVTDPHCTYEMAHQRCRRLWGRAATHLCAMCSLRRATDWAYDGTDPTALSRPGWYGPLWFSRYPEFYMPLCRSCHVRFDIETRQAAVVNLDAPARLTRHRSPTVGS